MTTKTEADAGADAGLGEAPTSVSGGLFRWAIVAVVVVVLSYPLALWLRGGGVGFSGTAAQSAQRPAFEHHQTVRHQDAITAAAKSALAAEPTTAETYNSVARSYLGSSQFDEGIQASQQAIRSWPGFQLVRYDLASNQQAQAKTAGTPAPASRPSAADALLDQSQQQAQAGSFEECIGTAKLLATLDPTSARAFNNIGFCAAKLQRWDEAIRNTQEAIRLAPDFQLAKNNLAWIQQERAKAAGAPAPASPPSAADALLDQSQQQAQAGSLEECIGTATQAAKLDPTSARAFNNIGFCAAKLKRWDEAIRNTQEAIRLAPDFQLAKNNLAWIQQEKLKVGGSKAN